MPDSPRDQNLAIDLADIHFTWPSGLEPVLALECLSVPAGARLFIRGPSGSGKSTLLGLIGGVLTPGQGHLRVLGQDLMALSAAARDRFRADQIGFVFQQFNLLPYLGLVDNVLLASRFSRRRAERIRGDVAGAARRCLAALGLDDEDLLARPVSDLSVGQQQRVAVARALLGEPGLVIADEPTSALDTETRAAFMELLFAECERTGATLLFVSHDPSLASGFDQVLELPEINRARGART